MAYTGKLPPGVSQAEVDAFLVKNPGDEGRVPTAFGAQPAGASTSPALQGLAAAAPSASGSGGGGTGGGGVTGSPATSVGGAMGGLDMSGMMGMQDPLSQFMPGQPGQLRQTLGSRLYPNEQSALAGLGRAY